MGPTFKNLTNGYTKQAVISSSATVRVLDVPYAIKPKTNSTAKVTVPSYFEKYRPPKVCLIEIVNSLFRNVDLL